MQTLSGELLWASITNCPPDYHLIENGIGGFTKILQAVVA